MQKEKTSIKRGRAVRIIISIIIVALIVGTWFYKNTIEKMSINTSNEITDVIDVQAEIENEQILADEVELVKGYFSLHETEKIDLEELKSYGLPILIDFGADSCVPCKEMAPVLSKLNEQFAGKAIILFVDVWKYQELMAGFPVEVIPTQILIDREGNPYIPSEDTSVQFIHYTYEGSEEIVYTAHQGGLTEEQALTILYEMGIEE